MKHDTKIFQTSKVLTEHLFRVLVNLQWLLVLMWTNTGCPNICAIKLHNHPADMDKPNHPVFITKSIFCFHLKIVCGVLCQPYCHQQHGKQKKNENYRLTAMNKNSPGSLPIPIAGNRSNRTNGPISIICESS